MSLNLLSAAYHFPEGIPLWPAKNLAGHRWTETIALESIDSLERIERISLVSKVVINDTAAETIGKRPWIIHEEQSGRMLRYFIQKFRLSAVSMPISTTCLLLCCFILQLKECLRYTECSIKYGS